MNDDSSLAIPLEEQARNVARFLLEHNVALSQVCHSHSFAASTGGLAFVYYAQGQQPSLVAEIARNPITGEYISTIAQTIHPRFPEMLQTIRDLLDRAHLLDFLYLVSGEVTMRNLPYLLKSKENMDNPL